MFQSALKPSSGMSIKNLTKEDFYYKMSVAMKNKDPLPRFSYLKWLQLTKPNF